MGDISVVEVKEASLHDWIDSHHPEKTLKFSGAFWNQFSFIDNIFSRLIKTHEIKVISTHLSKSILLPVYKFQVKGLEVVMRGNFHDWNLTFKVRNECKLDLNLILEPFGKAVSYYFHQGFPDEWVCSQPYKEGRKMFSMVVNNDYELYSLFRNIVWN